jgi:hypothetical protein
MSERPPDPATPVQPLDVLRHFHRFAASAWDAVMAANTVGLHQPLTYEFGYTPRGGEDPVERAVGAVEALLPRARGFPQPDPFAGDSVVRVAGVEGTSGHAVCYEALVRCVHALGLAADGRSPVLPASREAALPGLLSYREPDHVAYDPFGFDPYGARLGRRDTLIETLRGLLCRFRGLDAHTGLPHARGLRDEARARMSMLLEVEWNRAVGRLPVLLSHDDDPALRHPGGIGYDGETGLFRAGTFEKRFRKSARRARVLLAEFERRGWKERVPAIRVGGDAKSIVKDLNAKHLGPDCPMPFDTDHTGLFFVWEWKAPA